MKLQYFAETDTLYLVFNDRAIVETADISDHALVDLDANGNVVALTLEHAREMVDFANISLKDLSFAAEPAS